jgi:hypothetical protein
MICISHYSRLIISLVLWCFAFVAFSSDENTVYSSQIILSAKEDSAVYKTADGKRIYNTQKLAYEKPKIDGVLDDSCWLYEGYWSGGYKQFLPTEGANPSQKTEVKVLYDNENIYVAIRAYDNEPQKIDRRLGRRDQIVGDVVGICFDSYYDHRTGFEFDLTAAGSKIDLMLLNQGWDVNWDAVWYGEVGKEDSAWTAELRIPLSQLRYNKNADQVWGMHAWRWINRNQEEDQWNLMPRDNPGNLYSIGEMHGIKNLPHKGRYEFQPYVLGKIQTSEKEEGNPFATGTEPGFSAGLNGKIGLSSNFTLDYTINPDFGQVESDPSVLNLTAYETFYEEKRPFFLEGNNITRVIFNESDLMFYSRRIGGRPSYEPDTEEGEFLDMPDITTILGALKVTGKSKKGLSVGIIESLTSNEFAIIDSSGDRNKIVSEPLTNYFVGRVQKDINQSNTIVGGMVTATNRQLSHDYLNFMPKEAYTGGLDFQTFWSQKTYYLNFNSVFSHLTGKEQAMIDLQESSSRYYQRPDAYYLNFDSTRTSLSGYGTTLKIGKGSNGKWRYNTSFAYKSPGLEMNDLGYMQLTDRIEQTNFIQYVEDIPKGIFRSYNIMLFEGNYWNTGGQFLNTYLQLSTELTFKNKFFLYAHLLRVSDSYNTSLLRGGPAINTMGFWCNYYYAKTDPSKKLFFELNFHKHFYDDGKSDIWDIHPEFTYQIFNPLRIWIKFDYSEQVDYLHFISVIEYFTSSEPYAVAQLDQKTSGMTFSIDLCITPEFTIQYYGNPYVSAGKYSNYKQVVNSEATDYDDIFKSIEPVLNGDYLEVDENGDNTIDYTIENPDFNYREFRSNLVARWEFKPGSTFYLVWSQGRVEDTGYEHESIGENYEHIFDIYPDNVFLLKFNYWFSL